MDYSGGAFLQEEMYSVHWRIFVKNFLKSLNQDDYWVMLMNDIIDQPSITLNSDAFFEVYSKLNSPDTDCCTEISEYLSMDQDLYLFYDKTSIIGLNNRSIIILGKLNSHQEGGKRLDVMMILDKQSKKIVMFSSSYLFRRDDLVYVHSTDTYNEPLGVTGHNNESLEILIAIRSIIKDCIPYIDPNIDLIMSSGNSGIEIYPSNVYEDNHKIIVELTADGQNYFVIVDEEGYFNLPEHNYSLYLGYLSSNTDSHFIPSDEPMTLVVFDKSKSRYFLFNNIKI